jgi:hypothetical protein
MATKPKNKKRASGTNPSINPKPPSDKKPKPSKVTEELPEKAAAADKQPTKQKAKDEISEMFSAAKASTKRKPQQQQQEAAQGRNRKKSKEGCEEGSSKKKRIKTTPGCKGKKRDLYEDGDEVDKRPRRRTADGLAIYSAEELGFGKSNAGSTPLCPFDCDCCF